MARRLRLEDRSFGGRPDQQRVASEHALAVIRLRRRPTLQAGGDVDAFDRELPTLDVDVDDVAVLDGGNRAAHPASGATWPIMKPCVAPEKRPSVTIATDSPSPSPTMAAVTCSISRIPGPPRGPS